MVLVGAGLQHLPGGGGVLTQVELLKPCCQVVSLGELKAWGEGHIEDAGGCNNGCTGTQYWPTMDLMGNR